MDKTQKNQILETLVNSLQISSSVMDSAKSRYQSLGEWINRDASTIKKYSPSIYSQGSIRLGTAIRPINEGDDFDLDAVCVLKELDISYFPQKSIKNMVGEEIKSYVEANGFKNDAEEGKRCWTIKYSDSAKFHMDILPSVPDKIGFKRLLESRSLYDSDNPYHKYALAITDNTTSNYNYIDNNWPRSNPKGFHKWFLERSKITKPNRVQDSMMLAMESVEDIPDYKKLLPLQKSIMLMKRHRDMMFKDEKGHKPISIIITTLAAKAYGGEDNVADALDTILENMHSYVRLFNGEYIISNPVHPLENFADKWKREPVKRIYFYKWLDQIKIDVHYLLKDTSNKRRQLTEAFGSGPINKIFELDGVNEGLVSKAVRALLSLGHVKKPIWTENIKSGLKITCQISRNGFQTQYIKSGNPVYKESSLAFEAHLTNKVHSGSIKYYWQVANSGDEATVARNLRGEIFEGDITKGGKKQNETAKYKGEHIVRCFVVQHGELIAKSEVFVVKIL